MPEIPKTSDKKKKEETFHLQFKALLFGLSSSPWIFTKVMAEALVTVRLRGIYVITYLDDKLLFATISEKLAKVLKYTQDFL